MVFDGVLFEARDAFEFESVGCDDISEGDESLLDIVGDSGEDIEFSMVAHGGVDEYFDFGALFFDFFEGFSDGGYLRGMADISGHDSVDLVLELVLGDSVEYCAKVFLQEDAADFSPMPGPMPSPMPRMSDELYRVDAHEDMSHGAENMSCDSIADSADCDGRL